MENEIVNQNETSKQREDFIADFFGENIEMPFQFLPKNCERTGRIFRVDEASSFKRAIEKVGSYLCVCEDAEVYPGIGIATDSRGRYLRLALFARPNREDDFFQDITLDVIEG